MSPVQTWEAVHLYDGMDFIMAPVSAHMILFTNLTDGSVTLRDIALMNDTLSVKAENEYRAHQAAKDN